MEQPGRAAKPRRGSGRRLQHDERGLAPVRREPHLPVTPGQALQAELAFVERRDTARVRDAQRELGQPEGGEEPVGGSPIASDAHRSAEIHRY